MAKRHRRNEPRRLMPPWRGVGNNSAFIDQPGDLAPHGSMQNAIAVTPDKERPQVGTRWGTRKAFDTQLPGAVQSFCTVERSAGQTGLQVGPTMPVVGQNRIAGTLTGHCFVLDPTLSMFAGFRDPRAIAADGVNVAWHPTLPRVVFSTIYNKAGNIVTGMNLGDVNTRAVLWQADAEDKDPGGLLGSNPILGNHVALSDNYVFQVAERYIYVFSAEDGTYLKRYDMDRWSYEAMSVCVRADNTVLVGFLGTSFAGVLPNQPAIPQHPGSSHYRSGVACFRINDDDANPLTRISIGPQLAANALWYEANHGYVRLSEVLSRKPHGAVPYTLAAGPDGEFVVGMTNQGWGWNDTFPPDGRKPYRTLAMFDADGVLLWEADTFSRRVEYAGAWGTFYNDIPQIDADDNTPMTGTPKSSVAAVAIDRIGDVYAAGQVNSAGHNVFKHSGADGAPLWRFGAGSMVEQHAISVDPTDNNLWVALMRNDAWTGAAGRNAILLKLNSLDGSVLHHYDVTPVTPFGSWMVSVSPRGEVAFVTDYLA